MGGAVKCEDGPPGQGWLSVERNVILSGITSMNFQPPSFPIMQIHLPKYFMLLFHENMIKYAQLY